MDGSEHYNFDAVSIVVPVRVKIEVSHTTPSDFIGTSSLLFPSILRKLTVEKLGNML